MGDMRLSTLIARGGVLLIPVVACRVSVVSSRAIVTRIMWMRERLGSQVIVTNSHRLDSYIDSFEFLLHHRTKALAISCLP